MNLFKKDPLQIIAFQTYGTDTHLYIKGRALEDESIDLEQKSYFKLFINSWKRFETDEVKNTPLNIKLPNNKVLQVMSDEKGYFLCDEQVDGLRELTNEEGWLAFVVSYNDVNIQRKIQNENRFPGEILIPCLDAEFGVVSDIDDTILHTGLVSTFKWRVIYNTIMKRPSKRTPLKGAADFYHKLHRGSTGKKSNPIFYVSHSPWNLYRYLEFFLKKNEFPKGPILLRSFPELFRKRPLDEKPQKQREIVNLLNAYPDLNFILIGDSGEHDPDIYTEIAEEYPDRILAIYLRSVRHKTRMTRVRGLVERFKTTPMLLVEKGEQAIEHARMNNFIAPETQNIDK
ncbi:MAG: phosphatase domain-containing protein [Flavobacteriaceae bacterium]|nr:phosphatase domain-containing protein [Flavobacteriaceae bacterium]